MKSEEFTGRARAYADARPGYPAEALEYIRSLVPPDAVFAEIGAGTGKFTKPLARYGYKIYAVEPNADMREKLSVLLAPFPNVKIVDGAAEATTLPGGSVDAVVSAQALNWFDIGAFRAECLRIGKPNTVVITLYNHESDKEHGVSRYDFSTGALYKNPVWREFPNIVWFTRDRWLLYHSSMAGVPGRSDPGYEEYFAELNAAFDEGSAEGLLRHALVTKVCHEVWRV